jgi:serine phosphatase RsbU (regulator of sigma subunit)
MSSKYTIILLLVFNILNFRNFAQNKDSLNIRKLYFQAEDLEVSSPDSALIIYKKIVADYESKIKIKFIGVCYHRIAQIEFDQTNDFKKYFEYCYKAIKYFESINDTAAAMVVYQNQAISLTRQNRFEEAIAGQIKIYEYTLRNNDIPLHLNTAMSIAECYSSLNRNDTAIEILLNLEKKYLQNISFAQKGTLFSNIGNTYYNTAEATNDINYYKKAIEYGNKALICFDKEFDDESDKSFALGLIGAAYIKLGKYKEAESNYDKAIAIEEKHNHITDLNTLYFEMAELQIRLSNKDLALKYFFKQDSVRKFIYNEDNARSISEMKTLFETDKKDKENKLLQAEKLISNAKIKQQQTISYIIIGGLIIVSSLAFFIFNGLKKQRKANKIISEQKEEVHKQKAIIEEHQKETIDSINYAKKIQYALLAQEDLLKRNLSNYFIMFNPKDIVSGDFYWATEHNNKFYLAICDSTGHGVPGAFMSLLNMGFLSEAVKEKNIEEPHEIFNYVRLRLINSISSEQQKDGMDGILLCVDRTTNQITYSAANNEPILVSNNKVIELPKDKMPVGKGEKNESFTLHQVTASKGDVLYLYTDGYADQFGGPKGKKFKYKQLNDLLLNSCHDDLNQQKEILLSSFINWKGNLEQVDDVLIVGIKI